MQQPSAQHVDKKAKVEERLEDKATATVGFVGRAVQLSLGAALTTFGECVGEQLDFLARLLFRVRFVLFLFSNEAISPFLQFSSPSLPS